MPAILAIAYHSLVGSSGPGQQRLFLDRLRRKFRIDAGRAEKHQAVDAGEVRGMNDIGLDCQIVVNEIGGEGVVGIDAADLGGGKDDGVRTILLEPDFDANLIAQIDDATVGLEHLVAATVRYRVIADPTMPLWPATQILLPLIPLTLLQNPAFFLITLPVPCYQHHDFATPKPLLPKAKSAIVDPQSSRFSDRPTEGSTIFRDPAPSGIRSVAMSRS